MQPAFATLPLELFLYVLDELVGTRDSRQPIAYAPSETVSKTLRALTLVSRNIYLVASQYLYAHCLYLDNCTNYARFRRTLGLGLGRHPEALRYGEAGRNDRLFYEANVPGHIASMFISPLKMATCEKTPMVRLPQIIDLGLTIGATLKRLALDLQPVYTPRSEVIMARPHTAANNIFLHMPRLEELVCSYDVPDYFPHPPPNLKRLAMPFQDLTDTYLDFCFSISTLETLFFLRPQELSARHIDKLFARYRGHHLDVVLVDVNANHVTPELTRDWDDADAVIIWEVDVPKSYYGDEDDVVLCDGWIWSHGVQGTLWTQEKRKMRERKAIEESLMALYGVMLLD
ncbi:hypothetical protein K458DRAFT_308293 [Lentithecium fluviatile CBS 122367]|uniref:F-box domain-containing protein n=1 Tax=Lentithecium fluviatile CBS 122367 TaxID=1168545 RepID=A0A6G1IUS8_9PLEO|nr:hypothetical protein K458DRAFT_308293 [Lentithecium fluviatile CBS 122367]